MKTIITALINTVFTLSLLYIAFYLITMILRLFGRG